MKKVLTFGIMGLLILTLCGCDKKEKNEERKLDTATDIVGFSDNIIHISMGKYYYNNSEIVLNSDGTFTQKECLENECIEKSGTYLIEDNTLMISFSDTEEEIFKIENHNSFAKGKEKYEFKA